MIGRHETRRWILGAFVALVMALAALGAGGARAAEEDGAYSTGGYGSRAGFKKVCDGAKGTFIDDGDGNTECHYPDGGWTECDANGKDCWYTPPPQKLQPSTAWDPAAGEIATAEEGGGQAPPHAADSPTSAQPRLVAADDDQEQDHGKRKGKKGKKGKGGKGGKGRK